MHKWGVLPRPHSPLKHQRCFAMNLFIQDPLQLLLVFVFVFFVKLVYKTQTLFKWEFLLAETPRLSPFLPFTFKGTPLYANRNFRSIHVQLFISLCQEFSLATTCQHSPPPPSHPTNNWQTGPYLAYGAEQRCFPSSPHLACWHSWRASTTRVVALQACRRAVANTRTAPVMQHICQCRIFESLLPPRPTRRLSQAFILFATGLKFFSTGFRVRCSSRCITWEGEARRERAGPTFWRVKMEPAAPVRRRLPWSVTRRDLCLFAVCEISTPSPASSCRICSLTSVARIDVVKTTHRVHDCVTFQFISQHIIIIIAEHRNRNTIKNEIFTDMWSYYETAKRFSLQKQEVTGSNCLTRTD